MQPHELFGVALRQWIEVFMGHSMRNFIGQAKELGISVAQIGALMRIHRQGAPAVSDISQELGVTNAAASQMLERLVQAGLISRSEDPRDRRAKQIGLTAKGRLILEASLPARQKWLDDLAATLTPAEAAQVTEALQLLVAKARQLEPPSR